MKSPESNPGFTPKFSFTAFRGATRSLAVPTGLVPSAPRLHPYGANLSIQSILSIVSILSILSLLPPAIPAAQPSPLSTHPQNAPGSGSLADPIAVDGGLIRGIPTRIEGVRVYKGIPFATPPVGDLRWKPPQPVIPWSGVRSCAEFGPACPQPDTGTIRVPEHQDEDCLYLNVWAPVPPAVSPRPVMVWIHGGGHTAGAASLPIYDGARFAADGVVFVSINYRLGPLGYLAHPTLSGESPHKVSGNYGTLDQIAALQWVQRNIARFGGDPSNVTIFGESAGAVSCGVLLVSPLAKGLFHRAILESGTPAGVRTPLRGGDDSAEALGLRLFDKLGVHTVAQARAKSPRELIDALPPTIGPLNPGTKYGPIVDGWVIPDEPLKLVEDGHFQSVPFLIGTNADEGSLFTGRIPIKHAFGYRLALARVYKDNTDEVLKIFPADLKPTPKESLNQLITVAAFVSPARQWARAIARRQPNVYLYQFTRVSPEAAAFGKGAEHGFEIPYVFENGNRVLTDPADGVLSQTMHRYWIQFAMTGDPNVSGFPDWPRYAADTDQHLEFGTTVKVGSHLDQAGCDLFERLARDRIGIENTAGTGQ